MKCHRCPVKLRKAAKYCDGCGCPVDLDQYINHAIDERVAASEKRIRRKGWAVASMVFAGFLFIAGGTIWEVNERWQAGLTRVEQDNARKINEEAQKMSRDISARFGGLSSELTLAVGRLRPSVSTAEARLRDLTLTVDQIADRAAMSTAVLANHTFSVTDARIVAPFGGVLYGDVMTPRSLTAAGSPLNVVDAGYVSPPGVMTDRKYNTIGLDSTGSSPSWLDNVLATSTSRVRTIEEILNQPPSAIGSLRIQVPSDLSISPRWATPAVIKKD